MTEKRKCFEEQERRRFFRIEDAIHIAYTVMDPAEVEKRVDLLEKGMAGQFTLMSSIAAITAEMSSAFRRIESTNQDLACYLKSLDQKIDLLGKSLMADEMDLVENHASPVNLSASGIAILANESLEPGNLVEIKMLLMPTFAGILTYGEVIDCKTADNPDYKYIIRIDFSHLRDDDRDILIKHVIRKQGDLLRERRLEREATR